MFVEDLMTSEYPINFEVLVVSKESVVEDWRPDELRESDYLWSYGSQQQSFIKDWRSDELRESDLLSNSDSQQTKCFRRLKDKVLRNSSISETPVPRKESNLFASKDVTILLFNTTCSIQHHWLICTRSCGFKYFCELAIIQLRLTFRVSSIAI